MQVSDFASRRRAKFCESHQAKFDTQTYNSACPRLTMQKLIIILPADCIFLATERGARCNFITGPAQNLWCRHTKIPRRREVEIKCRRWEMMWLASARSAFSILISPREDNSLCMSLTFRRIILMEGTRRSPQGYISLSAGTNSGVGGPKNCIVLREIQRERERRE
jgi:hypothetical protein